VAAYVVFYITDVHVAAGAIIASEAGGTLTDVAGKPWTLEADSLIAAATPELHAELLAMAHETRT
jgi:fructose-1,6-bisphosphatase/inositol monophosphatase family enzyme